MFEQIISFIISPELQAMLFPLKIIFFVIDILILVFLVFTFFKTRWFKLLVGYNVIEFFTRKIYGGVFAKIRLGLILRRFSKMDGGNYNNLVIRLHKMLDIILAGLAPMHQAKTFSERLAKMGKGTFSNVTDIWEAHEVYRKIKNEPTYRVDQGTFLKVVQTYRQALDDLGV